MTDGSVTDIKRQKPDPTCHCLRRKRKHFWNTGGR